MNLWVEKVAQMEEDGSSDRLLSGREGSWIEDDDEAVVLSKGRTSLISE